RLRADQGGAAPEAEQPGPPIVVESARLVERADDRERDQVGLFAAGRPHSALDSAGPQVRIVVEDQHVLAARDLEPIVPPWRPGVALVADQPHWGELARDGLASPVG